MPSKLSDELQSVVQRSGTNTGGMRTEAERKSFSSNVRKDIASIVYQLNVVYKSLVEVLSSEQDLNALDFGLSGNVIFTHIRADEADAEAYWSADQARARTIKETIDVLLAEIARLENELQQAIDDEVYDDTEVRGLIQGNTLDLLQLTRDSMGPDYTLDGDGNTNLTYSLSQAIDAIGAFFSGFPTTGNTYTSTYPTLSLTVLLSDIVIDTTLAQSVITGLPADLGYIRTFIGMDTSGPETPTYSTHGTIVFVSDSTSLEEAIQAVDAAVATHGGRHISGGADEVDGDQLDIDWNPTYYTPAVTPAEVSNVDHLTAHLYGIDQALNGKASTAHASTHITGGSDEIDGDQLDIDFTPANYTPSTAPAEATDLDHLAAHLSGIDTALAAAGGADTLQDAYDNGGAGTAGDITLVNADGEIRFLNDTVSPLTNILSWVDDASADIGHLTNVGIRLVNNAYLEQNESTSAPAAPTGAGRWFVDTGSGGGAHAEGFFRNDNGSDAVAQITRDGIVKELEVGHTVVFPANFTKISSDAGPVVVAEDMTDFAVSTLDYDPTSGEKAYCSVPIPIDEDSAIPARVKFVGHFLLKPNGGPHPGGTGIAFDIQISDGTTNATVANKEIIDPGWQTAVTESDATLGASNVDHLVVLDWTPIAVQNNDLGVLNVRLERKVADAADTWDDDVGLVALHVIWYR